MTLPALAAEPVRSHRSGAGAQQQTRRTPLSAASADRPELFMGWLDPWVGLGPLQQMYYNSEEGKI